jgi:hypothetical protein
MLASLLTRKVGKVLKKAHARLELREQEGWFIDRGRTAQGRRLRTDLVRAFRRVGAHVKCAHSDMEVLRMADFLLDSPARGPMVECGCYKGGATAKLSLVARATGRRLVVCDSFEGLPQPGPEDRGLVTLHDEPYAKGMYAGAEEEVRGNVAAFGAAEVCEYRKGYFHNTLPGLRCAGLSCAFIDVDLISSARDCLLALWPRLAEGGRVYLHEARDLRFVRGITDAAWWQAELGQGAPLLVGAGFGCGDGAPQLAYFDKVAARVAV